LEKTPRGIPLPILLVIIIVIIIITLWISGMNKAKVPQRKYTKPVIKKPDYASESLPAGLGMRPEFDSREMEQRLEKALEPGLLERLKERVLKEHPEMGLAEYEWKLLELKRYFAMNAILRQVPMFSESVDQIWHEMLMFTREYQLFCDSFLGTMIHHAPHSQPQPMKGERAWFDWIYGHLFELTPFSNEIWGRFYAFPLEPERMEQFRRLKRKS
jgi:hypothetical protein